MGRERDIRAVIQTALVATGQFERVALGRTPEDRGQGTCTALAVILPARTRRVTGWDAAPSGPVEYACTIRLAIYARNEDPELLDALAEQLLNVAQNAINGQALVAGLTVPQKTYTSDWSYTDTPLPERRIDGTITVGYLETWTGFDTTT